MSRVSVEFKSGNRRANGRDCWRYTYSKKSVWIEKEGRGQYEILFFVGGFMCERDTRTNLRAAKKDAREFVLR